MTSPVQISDVRSGWSTTKSPSSSVIPVGVDGIALNTATGASKIFA